MEDPASKDPVIASTERGAGDDDDSGCCPPDPVENCCCCFSLRTGVAIMAVLDLLYGITIPVYFPWEANNDKHDLEEALRHCSDPGGVGCADVHEADEVVALDRILFPVAMLLGVLYVVSGALGLFAVIREHAQAALFFTIGQLVVVLVECAVSVWCTANNTAASDLGSSFVGFLFALYFALVSWSYHVELKKKSDVVDEETPLK